MKVFDGVGVAMITPFKNGEVDMASFSALADEMIARDADALVIGGSTGEPHSLSLSEKVDLIKTAVKIAKGRVPVIGGINQTSTRDAVIEGKALFEGGADAFLAITPYCSKCTDEGCFIHYSKIKEIGLPIIAYNVPSRTGYDMPSEVVGRLAQNDVICGIKQASATMRTTMEYVSALKGNGHLYSGEDDLTFSMRALGGVGVISVAALAIPEAIKALFVLEYEKAAELQLQLNGFINSLFSEVNPVPVKYFLSVLRKCENELRCPLTPLKEENRERLLLQAKRIGLI